MSHLIRNYRRPSPPLIDWAPILIDAAIVALACVFFLALYGLMLLAQVAR